MTASLIPCQCSSNSNSCFSSLVCTVLCRSHCLVNTRRLLRSTVSQVSEIWHNCHPSHVTPLTHAKCFKNWLFQLLWRQLIIHGGNTLNKIVFFSSRISIVNLPSHPVVICKLELPLLLMESGRLGMFAAGASSLVLTCLCQSASNSNGVTARCY